VLDGGHLVICAYEAVTRREASPRVLDVVFRGGAAAILVLLAVITWNDLSSIYRQFYPPAAVGEQQRPPG
jgi:regulator of sigma E protease